MSLHNLPRPDSSQEQPAANRQFASAPVMDMDDCDIGLQRNSVAVEVDQGPPLMFFEKDNVMRDLYPLVKAVEFRKYCVFEACSSGLRIIVDDESYQQSVVFIAKANFNEFRMLPGYEKVEFRIYMTDLLECLSILGKEDTSPLVMTYQCIGSEVLFMRRNESMLVKFSIRTHYSVPKLDFEFKDDDVICRIMMRLKPDVLFDVIKDLDKSSPTVTIRIVKDSIDFSTAGELGKVNAAIPITSEIIDEFTIVGDEIVQSYKVTLIQRMVPALHSCDKISLRIDKRGMMQAQFIANQMNTMQNYIEFYVVPDLGGSSSDEVEEFDMEDLDM